MDEEDVMYIVFALLMPMMALSVLQNFGGGLYPLIAFMLIILSVAFVLIFNWIDYAVFSLITSFLGITFQPALGYKITKEQNSIVKNVSGLYYATGFLTANLFPYVFKQEVTEQSQSDESKLVAAPESWERAVMNIDFPFKFHVISTGQDVQMVRDELEGKRSYQEFQLSRALQSGSAASDVVITNIQRKINIIQGKIDRISQGERPIATLMYIETTAIGVSERAALDALEVQMNGLGISLSSLDVDLRRIVGRELYTLFRFNFGLPTTFEEIKSMFGQER